MSNDDWSDESSSAADLEGWLNAFVVSCLSKTRPTRISRLKPLSTKTHHLCHSEGSAKTKPEGEAERKRQRADLKEELAVALRQDGGDREEVSNTIAAEIFSAIKGCEDKAATALLIRNGLADPLNTKLRKDVLERRITVHDLVMMNELDLVNPIERERIDKEREVRMNQKTVEYVEKLSMTLTTLFKCPSCGCDKCYANFRSTDYVKWQGDDPNPTLLRCTKCGSTFKE